MEEPQRMRYSLLSCQLWSIKCCSLEEIEKDIEERDYRDMHRETAPLRQAEDAVLVDTSDMTIEETVRCIETLVKERS